MHRVDNPFEEYRLSMSIPSPVTALNPTSSAIGDQPVKASATSVMGKLTLLEDTDDDGAPNKYVNSRASQRLVQNLVV